MKEEMTLSEAMAERHSVRSFLDKPIPGEIREELEKMRQEVCSGKNVRIRIVYDEPEGFDSRLAHYGRFRNVRNYMVLSATHGQKADEEAGYAGEQLVLRAQQLGLRTCWAALTFNKKAVRRMVPEGEDLIIVIALGYGAEDGTAHRNQNVGKLAMISPDDPEWYQAGVRAVLLAPTAVNQQKFRLERDGEKVRIRSVGIGPCLRIDLGIVRCHFEIGAGPGHLVEN